MTLCGRAATCCPCAEPAHQELHELPLRGCSDHRACSTACGVRAGDIHDNKPQKRGQDGQTRQSLHPLLPRAESVLAADSREDRKAARAQSTEGRSQGMAELRQQLGVSGMSDSHS